MKVSKYLYFNPRYRRKLSGQEEWSDDKYKPFTQPMSLDRPKVIGQSQYSLSMSGDRSRHERRRTTSIEKDFQSATLTGYGADLDEPKSMIRSKGMLKQD